MSKNRLVSGAEPKEGSPPFEALRRQTGRFWPYPYGTRRILLLNRRKALVVVDTTAVFSPVQQQNPARATPET